MHITIFITTICLLMPISILAQTAQNSTVDTEKGFDFSSDKTVVVFSEGREKTTLSGNAVVVSKSTSLSANYIEVYGEDFRFVQCIGDVEVLDTENGYRLKTNSLFFDRELEIIRGRGGNVMEDFKNEIVVKGEFLAHHNIENRSEIQVGTRILGADITASAEFIRYQRASQLLEFSGLPLVRWKGDRYQAARIIVDMDDDTVDLQGEVYGEIDIEDAAENDETSATENDETSATENDETSAAENDEASATENDEASAAEDIAGDDGTTPIADDETRDGSDNQAPTDGTDDVLPDDNDTVPIEDSAPQNREPIPRDISN